MATYDRTAQKQSKKGKSKQKGQSQGQTKKRKYYSEMIPFRKIDRMLQSNGAKFVGEMANRLKADVVKGDNGVMAERLMAMAADGIHDEFGARAQELAKQALEFVK